MTTPKPAVTPLEDRTVPAVLTGTVFGDTNGDGRQAVTEPGLAGVTVNLDVNSTGVTTQSTTTDANGVYTFGDVPAGRHTVTALPPDGGQPLTASKSQVVVPDAAGEEQVVTPTILGVPLRARGSAQGVVYADLNQNGKRDADEPGLGGVAVSVDVKGDGTVEFTTTTKPDGSFLVANVPDGLAKVTIVPPANFRSGTDGGVDTVVVSSTGAADPAQLGLRPVTGLSGRVTLAAGGAASGLAGVTVALDAPADGPPWQRRRRPTRTGGTCSRTSRRGRAHGLGRRPARHAIFHCGRDRQVEADGGRRPARPNRRRGDWPGRGRPIPAAW